MKRKTKILIMLLALALTLPLLFAAANLSDTGRVISWGVSPNKQERTPQIPDGSGTMMEKHGAIFTGDTSLKKVYFTFDLGYEAGYTAEVLDILKEHNIQAVFFLCGNYLKETELMQRMISEGHLIGNHTDRHKDLPSLDNDGITKDIADFKTQMDTQYPNTTMKFFRPPSGKFCERTLRIAKEQSYTTMMWSIAIVDWGKTPIDATASAKKITERIHPGAIILLHITNSGMPKMLRELLPQVIDKGYEVGRVSDI